MPLCSLTCVMTILLTDLHMIRAGVLRTGLGEHHEQYVDHNAQAADRNKVPAEVICVDNHEISSDSGDDESSIATSESGESGSESDTAEDDPSSLPLATDLEQYELMQTAYKAVGLDFEGKEELIGPEYDELLRVSWLLLGGFCNTFSA